MGFHKKGSGLPSITWPESVDEALCYGWIDGVRKSLGETSYTIRFTPRRERSIWSAVNVRRVEELTAEGRMEAAGLRAFEQRSEKKTAVYAYEQADAPELGEPREQQFRADAAAWDFFQGQPASYRKAAIWWVTGAKKEETRSKRMATLIADSGRGRTVAPLTPPGKRK